VIDLLGIPDLCDVKKKKKKNTFVSHLFGSTVFADLFLFKHCLTPNCC